jgi:hypothetical protein
VDDRGERVVADLALLPGESRCRELAREQVALRDLQLLLAV